MPLQCVLPRVVVTGLGLATCLGVGAEHNWSGLLSGKTGISRIQKKDYEDIPSQVAGFVPRGNKPGEFNISVLGRNPLKELSEASAFALVAASDALQMAGWNPESEEDRRDSGVAIGMGMVDLDHIVDTGTNLKNHGYKKVTPHFIPKILINMAAGHVSLRHNLQGPNHAVSTACTSGLHAVGDAMRFIQHGQAKVMVCGGTEASLTPLGLAGFARMRALSTNFNDQPEKASRPFDKDRDGFVMSEGAGILILEEYEHAKKRGAKMYAEILGYGVSGDAHHITAPHKDGIGAFRCMDMALKSANISPEDVCYINAHATSTPIGDEIECNAIHNLFRGNKKLYVSSTKGATGHLLGAAGAIEAAFTVLTCYHRIAPGTLNLEHPINSDLQFIIKNEHKFSDRKIIALTNSFGFGGTNASICFGTVNDC